MSSDVLAWSKSQLADYGPGLAALVMLAVFSGRIRRAVNSGRLGQTTPLYRLPPATVWTFVVLPVGWWLWNLWVSQAREAFFMHITEEDGWMEYGQMLLLVLGSIASGLLARSLWIRRRFWALAYLLLALALFWAAGEEISWGQRLLHLATPAWFASHNTQQEMNVHNLAGVTAELSSLVDQALSWAVFLSAAAWMTGFHRVKRLYASLWLPHPSLIPAFCCVISYWWVLCLYQLLHPEAQKVPEVIERLQEPREVILYFSALVFLLIVRSTLRADPNRPATRSLIPPSPRAY